MNFFMYFVGIGFMVSGFVLGKENKLPPAARAPLTNLDASSAPDASSPVPTAVFALVSTACAAALEAVSRATSMTSLTDSGTS